MKSPYVGFPATAMAALSLILSGCGSKHGGPKEAAATLPVAQVSVQRVETKLRPTTEEVVATVRPKLHATLEAKLNGRIEQMPIALGDKVQARQLIARLEAGEIEARLEQAEASLGQAERDWSRVSRLFEQQGVTRAEYDAAEARFRVAKGTVAEAKAMKGYVEILAPFDGVVTRKWADVGDLAVPGKSLIELVDPSALQLEADIPEAIAGRIHAKARLVVRADGFNGELAGVVTEIAPAADPVRRTFRIKLDLPPSEAIKPGQFARLLVPLGENNSLLIPTSAILQRGQMEIVFVAQNQHAQMHLVRTGRRFGDEAEILSGLDSGDLVIVSDPAQLMEGQPVEAR